MGNEKDVRDALRLIIQDKGFNQAAIARKARMTPAVLSAVLRKIRRLDANEFFGLCDALGMGPDDIRTYNETA